MHRVLKPGGKVVCLETSQPTLPVFKQVSVFTLNLLCYFRKNVRKIKKSVNGCNRHLIFLINKR